MNDLKDNLIAGEWKRAESYTPNINPSNLADVIAEYAQGGASDVDAAVAAATAAFPAWASGSIQTRSDALDKIGTEILARRGRVRSSSSSPASACVWRVSCCLRCARASPWRSRASRSAWWD